MLQVDEALACVLTHAHPHGSERVALAEACGRYLAEDILTDADLPPFDRAAMDGYAVRAGDVAHVPATLAPYATPTPMPYMTSIFKLRFLRDENIALKIGRLV